MKRKVKDIITSQISSEHKVQDEKAVLVILERISHVDDEGVIDLEMDRVIEQCHGAEDSVKGPLQAGGALESHWEPPSS